MNAESNGRDLTAAIVAKLAAAFVLLLPIFNADAATFYVDGTATGSHNGTSWANAWTNFTQIAGLTAGDTVYISGGATGSSITYVITSTPGYPGLWIPAGGTASNRITYQIGQDAAHNGTAIFSAPAGYGWLTQVNNINISGDAGDGKLHFKLTNYVQGIVQNNNEQNYRVCYVDFGSYTGNRAIDLRGAKNAEVDHIYCKLVSMTVDDFAYFSFAGPTWDNNKIHDCTILLPNAGNGTGADGLQADGTGFSIYNNVIIGYATSYTGGQHQDGWQSTGNGRYIKIYGNFFLNIGNYPIFADAYAGGFSDMLIYNNVLAMSDTGIEAGASPGGVVAGTDGGYIGPSPCVFSNVVEANNVVMDYPHHTGGGIGNPTGSAHPTVFLNCMVLNNVSVNGGVFNTADGGSNVVYKNNVNLTSGQAATSFAGYVTWGGTNNNLRLLAAAGMLIAKGTNLAAYFATDRDGNARPGSGAWDAGAYQLVVTNPPPAVALDTPAAGSAYAAPATVSLAASVTSNGHAIAKVQFFNGAALLGESVSAPYGFTWSGVSTGSYSLKARAVYDTSNTVDSALAGIVVTNPPPVLPPVVLLTAPLGGAFYSALATISLAASVTSNGHTIAKIQFYSGATLLGESVSAPYALTWNSVGAGSYGLKATAVYDATNAADSSIASVVVTNPPAVPPTNLRIVP